MLPNILRVPRGELRLFATFAMCVAALIGLSGALAYQLWPEPDRTEVTVSIGTALPNIVRPGGELAITYEICNLTNENASVVFIAAWADGDPTTRVVTIAEAGLAPAPISPGCQDIIVERTVPRAPDTWRRVGLLDVQFADGHRVQIPFVSEEVLVLGE